MSRWWMVKKKNLEPGMLLCNQITGNIATVLGDKERSGKLAPTARDRVRVSRLLSSGKTWKGTWNLAHVKIDDRW